MPDDLSGSDAKFLQVENGDFFKLLKKLWIAASSRLFSFFLFFSFLF
jgi:hypothetical protein